ncbi:neutrophil cytosol factor 2-like [Dendronephthya gigantea]|uniref:neutrophil cytosol factor 2-like n=1 Tax=Dendronephthya gigantea TaxID=151771 RepID=UPI00106BABA0|nr:neutrophil cytosol factor 2-like [Dendronephthya gigantea]
MTLVENLQTWKEAVESYNEGDFQRSLDKFRDMKDSSAKIAFNIGRTYLSLCDLQAAIQAFQEVIKKDEHLAVGHFMLGVVNLMCTRYSDALVNFNETFRNLRESKFIDYKQLGMRYKLYKCEVLLNRAVCLSSLGYIDSAVEDLLAGLQCKVEPRHSIIDVSLNNLQSGQGIEFLVMDAIFQPPKSKTANLEKRDYLGKSQVVVDSGAYETMETPLHLRGRINSSAPTATSKPPLTDIGESYRVLYDFTAQNANEVSVKAGDIITVTETADDGWFTMVTNDSRKNGLVPGSYVEKYKERDEPVTERQALLTDLRKKETRQSLRKVKPPVNKQQYKPLPGERHSSVIESDHTYANGYREHPRKERPKTVELGGLEKMSPKPLPRVEPKMHAGPPKFRRKNSLENILAEKSPKGSPRFGKKGLGSKKGETNNNDIDDDDGDYEHIPDVTEVKPYAVHDVITPAERLMSTNGRKAPERPAPPPKVVTTMKPSRVFAPPTVAPRFPRAKSISTVGSITSTVEAKPTLGSPTFPKPVKMPPKIPQSPPKGPQSPRRAKKDTETPAKETRSQNVALQFVVSTSLDINASTTPEDIQNAAKEAIARNIASLLCCEKDGKKIRLADFRGGNISDLVKDGKLKILCGQ